MLDAERRIQQRKESEEEEEETERSCRVEASVMQESFDLELGLDPAPPGETSRKQGVRDREDRRRTRRQDQQSPVLVLQVQRPAGFTSGV